MKLHTLLAWAVVLNVGVVPVHGGDQTPAQGGTTQTLLAQLGAPEPGSVSDQETTRKQRNPAKDHQTDQNTQVTLGGAKSFVIGAILKIDGDHYFVKDEESGDEARLLVNTDTRKICSVEATSGSRPEATMNKPRGAQNPDASEAQARQGQRKDETAMGSGSQIGGGTECFKPGDRVKAEVSDIGTVTTIRLFSETRGSKQASTGDMLPAESVGMSSGEAEDRSPSAEKLKKHVESSRAPADLRAKEGAEPRRSTDMARPRDGGTEVKGGQVVRGNVLRIDDEFVFVKDAGGKEVRLHVDKTTIKGQVNLKDESFKEGDRIEAYMMPNGHAHSISLIRAQSNKPGDPEGGE